MMAAALCRDDCAAAPEQPLSLRAGFGAAVQGGTGCVLVLRPLDCRVASAPRNDNWDDGKRGSDQRGRLAWP